MTKSYKSLITKMIKEQPSGLTYSKILANFRNEYPDKYRKSFIRLALSKEPFKLSRKKYVLGKKKITKRKAILPPCDFATYMATDPTIATSTTVIKAKKVKEPKVKGISLKKGPAQAAALLAATSSVPVTATLVQGPKATIYDNSSVAAVPTLTPTPTTAVAHWQYEHDGWKNYVKEASDVVEAAYQDWLKNPHTDVRAIKSGEWQYTVDFNKMLQQNVQHENHTTRNVRRTLVSL